MTHLKVFVLSVSAKPGVSRARLPGDSEPTFVKWCGAGGGHWHRRFMNLSDVEVRSPRPASVSWKHCITCCEGLLQRWHDLAADGDIMYGYRKSKTSGAELAFSVPPCLFHTSSRGHATTPTQMIDEWRYPAGTWSTWHCKRSCPTGSTFICGHCNVNSLSLSISEQDYTGLHWI